MEKMRGAEFCRKLDDNERAGKASVVVYEENDKDAGPFWVGFPLCLFFFRGIDGIYWGDRMRWAERVLLPLLMKGINPKGLPRNRKKFSSSTYLHPFKFNQIFLKKNT
jgi:hypothetical protein